MNTQNAGDKLADKITNAIALYAPIDTRIKGALERALAEYRRPLPHASILTPAQIADGWLEWHGGECPVLGDSNPAVMLRSGVISDGTPVASGWFWKHAEIDGDILAYRPDPHEALKRAHAEGKVLQRRLKSGYAGDSDWNESCVFDERFEYRVKPEPVMVPLGPGEVPPGSALRYIETETHTRRYGFAWFLVREVPSSGDGVVVHDEWRPSFDFMQQSLEISRDGGKTWQKCEKPQEDRK